jgi:hypothetical protein
MPLARTKPEIVKRLNAERRRLEANLAKLTPAQIVQPETAGKSSIKDILAHLAEWESFMPNWVEASRRGENIPEPDWKKTDVLNDQIYQKYQDHSLDEVLAYFRKIHRQFMVLVETMPEDEMLTPARYTFLGKGAIWDWLNAYAAHDMWGKKHVLKQIKELT